MKYFVFIIIIATFLVAIVGCKKDEENKVYHNSGTLYDKDGTTPLANEELILHGTDRDPWSFSAGEVGRTTTDNNGLFSFKYTQTNYSHFHIASPKTGHLLTHGNVNRDFSRDVCIERKALLTVIVTINRQIKNDDTLYIWGPPPSSSSVSTKTPNGFSGSSSFYPNPSNQFVIKVLNHPWDGAGKNINNVIRYGLGWEDFEKCFERGRTIPYQSIPYEINGFPYVDTIKVTIK